MVRIDREEMIEWPHCPDKGVLLQALSLLTPQEKPLMSVDKLDLIRSFDYSTFLPVPVSQQNNISYTEPPHRWEPANCIRLVLSFRPCKPHEQSVGSHL